MASDEREVFKSVAGLLVTILVVEIVRARVLHLGHSIGVGLIAVVVSFLLFATSWFGLFRRKK